MKKDELRPALQLEVQLTLLHAFDPADFGGHVYLYFALPKPGRKDLHDSETYFAEAVARGKCTPYCNADRILPSSANFDEL